MRKSLLASMAIATVLATGSASADTGGMYGNCRHASEQTVLTHPPVSRMTENMIGSAEREKAYFGATVACIITGIAAYALGRWGATEKSNRNP